MIEIEQEQNEKVKCILIGEPNNNLEELSGLVDTLGLEILQKYTLSRLEVHPAYGMGKGKAEEIANLAKELQADCIIFDFNLEPTKQRNWEKLSKIPCFDRQEVIIRIFAQRAQTKEAVLQVELAKLNYSLPRLAHTYGDMARQRGGSYGSKGSGETQLELDQRRIRQKIFQTKKELEEVIKTRETQRKKRSSIPVPSCALIGYTNAGKSSLLNGLTGAETLVENKLFATLDPLTKKLNLKDGTSILLTDTVGFISNLPHSLIDAFKSTLLEAKQADLQLIVLDASDPNVEEHYKTVCSVLKEIDSENSNSLIILNKIDLIKDNPIILHNLKLVFPKSICISTKTKEGFDKLNNEIIKTLLGKQYKFLIPIEENKIINEIRKDGIILKELWKEDYIEIVARVKNKTLNLIKKYKVGSNYENNIK